MTGSELARIIIATRGKIAVKVSMPDDCMWVYAEKRNLAIILEQFGDLDVNMRLVSNSGNWYLEDVRI